MTEIKFGDRHDKSSAKFDIKSAGESATKIGVGDGFDQSSLDVQIHDGATGGPSPGVPTNSHSPASSPTNQQKALNTKLAFTFGFVLIVMILTLVVLIPNPTPMQAKVFSAVLALAAGGFASVMPGLLNVRLTVAKQVLIGATGALGVFVIVYFFVPAMSR